MQTITCTECGVVVQVEFRDVHLDHHEKTFVAIMEASGIAKYAAQSEAFVLKQRIGFTDGPI